MSPYQIVGHCKIKGKGEGFFTLVFYGEERATAKLRLYSVDDKYISYLRNFDKKVFLAKEEDRITDRKYLGIVLNINDLNYFVPLSSPKDSDYMTVNGVKTIRKSNTAIMRMIAKDKNGKEDLKGTIKFSNMIPVPEAALIEYDVNKETDQDYKILVLKELLFIHANREKIIKSAKVIYQQRITNQDIGYIRNTVDFLLLEEKCKEYKKP